MAKPICKTCRKSLFGELINGARQRRCTSCHASFKRSFGKKTCNNCGVEILAHRSTCETCQNNFSAPRTLTRSNINQMIWYEGKKAWE